MAAAVPPPGRTLRAPSAGIARPGTGVGQGTGPAGDWLGLGDGEGVGEGEGLGAGASELAMTPHVTTVRTTTGRDDLAADGSRRWAR